MDVKAWRTPQEKQFSDALESEAENVLAGARTLRDLFDGFGGAADHRKKIEDVEHRGDEIVHPIYGALNRSFVRPLAKEGLGGLASKLDDVLDHINATAPRIAIYEIAAPTKPMTGLAAIILQATEQIRGGVRSVRDPKGDGRGHGGLRRGQAPRERRGRHLRPEPQDSREDSHEPGDRRDPQRPARGDRERDGQLQAPVRHAAPSGPRGALGRPR